MTVRFTGAFESGQLNAKASVTDGFLLQTLQGSAFIELGTGGASAATGYDTRVVSSEVYNSETILPRKGNYFVRSEIFFNKDYSVMPFNGGKNKPRSAISMSDPTHRIEFDTENFLGFSLRLPNSFWHETGVRDDRGSIQLLTCYPGTDTSATFFYLAAYVKSPNTTANWYLGVYTDASSTQESAAKLTEYDLGSVVPDIGKWTDFVIRYRANPFSVNTNPSGSIAGSKDQLFTGNQGIFQVWKGTGNADSQGNRVMTQVGPNIVGAPVGLVPKASDLLQHSLRIYKYGWHNNSTASTNPVWIGFDEVRMGDSFAEVAPSQLSEVGSTTEITSVNASVFISPDSAEVPFTGANLSLAVSGSISNAGASETLSWVVSNASGGAGGKCAVGSLSGFTDPNVDFNLNVIEPATYFTNFSTWTTLFARKVALTDPVWDFTTGTTVAGGTTVGGATYDYSNIESPSEAVSSADKVTVRWIYKPGTSNKCDVRVISGSEYIRIYGTPESPSISQSGIGTVESWSNVALSDTGAYLVTLTFTPTTDISIKKRFCNGTTTSDSTFHALMCATFYNEDTVATQVHLATTIDIPDTVAPELTGLVFTLSNGTSGAITVNTNEFLGDGWAVITDSITAPTQEQVRTGLDHLGNLAQWGGYAAVTSSLIRWFPSGLPVETNKYAHVYHEDGSGNQSDVVTSSLITGTAGSTVEFDIVDADGNTVESDILGSLAAGTLIVFDGTTRRFSKNGRVFTGTIEKMSIYDRNILVDPANAILLAEVLNVIIVNGQLTITEADLSYGSLAGLNINTDYWFYLFNADLTAISIGTINPR